MSEHRCPRCRQDGAASDCSAKLNEPRKDTPMSSSFDDDSLELEVTLKFSTPAVTSLDLDPHQIATRLREQWIEEPAGLVNAVIDAVADDFDLQVRPVSVL